MSRIVDDEPPIKTHPASQAYRDNWERMFGKELDAAIEHAEKKEAATLRGYGAECTCPHGDAREPDHDRACAFYNPRCAGCGFWHTGGDCPRL